MNAAISFQSTRGPGRRARGLVAFVPVAMTRAGTITLLGATVRGRFRYCLGLYTLKRNEPVNGHPYYVKDGQEELLAMWYHPDCGWLVGATSDLGQQRGMLQLVTSASLPTLCGALVCWLCNINGDWQAAPFVRCVAGDARAELASSAAAELEAIEAGAVSVKVSAPSDLVALYDGAESQLAGIYDRRPSGMIHGRASFVKRGDPSLMLFCREPSHARVPGATLHVGGYGWVVARSVNPMTSTLMAAVDSSSCPEQIARDPQSPPDDYKDHVWSIRKHEGGVLTFQNVPHVRIDPVFDEIDETRKRRRSSSSLSACSAGDEAGDAINDALARFGSAGAQALQALSMAQLIHLQQAIGARMTEVHQSDINAAEALKEKHLCSVCLDSVKEMAFVPCGHSFCESCAARVPRCPICKQDATSRVRIFLDV